MMDAWQGTVPTFSPPRQNASPRPRSDHSVLSESVPIPVCPGPRVEAGHRGDRADLRDPTVGRGSHFSFSFSSSHLLHSRGKGRRIHPAPSNGPIVTSWHFRPAGPAAVRRAAARGTARQELPRRDWSRRTTTVQKGCDGRRLSSVLARYHSGISCWPASIGRSPVLRPPSAGLRANEGPGCTLHPGSGWAAILLLLFLLSSCPRLVSREYLRMQPSPPSPPVVADWLSQ